MLYIDLALAGLVIGGMYALNALGIVLIYKGTGVVNFAQGAVGMFGTYIYANWVLAGKNELVGLCLGIVSACIVGVAISVIIMRPLRGRSVLIRSVVTFGVLLLLEGYAVLRWSPNTLDVPDIFHNKVLQVGSVFVGTDDLVILAIAILATLGMSQLLTRTTLGKAIQATAVSPETTQRMGYRSAAVEAFTWAVGSAIAALAGIAIASQIGLTQQDLVLDALGSLVAALFGGFNSLIVTMLAGIAIGVAQSLMTNFVSAGWSEALPFIAVWLLLMARGRRIPGRGEEVQGNMPRAPFPRTSYGMLGVLALLVLAPLLIDPFWQSIETQAAGMAIIAISVVVSAGYLGYISLAQWSIAGIGGYVTLALIANNHVSAPLALSVGVLAAAAAGLLLAVLGGRIRSIELMIATFGVAVAIQDLVLQGLSGSNDVSVGQIRLFGLSVQGIGLTYFAIIILLLVLLGVWAYRRSSLGQKALAVRASERASLASGISVAGVKFGTIVLASVLAGLGGAIWGLGVGTLSYDSFDPLTSIEVVVFVFLNGIGVLSGGLAAGIAMACGIPFFDNILHIEGAAIFDMIGGAGIVLALIRHPNGVFGSVRDRSSRLSDPISGPPGLRRRLLRGKIAV